MDQNEKLKKAIDDYKRACQLLIEAEEKQKIAAANVASSTIRLIQVIKAEGLQCTDIIRNKAIYRASGKGEGEKGLLVKEFMGRILD